MLRVEIVPVIARGSPADPAQLAVKPGLFVDSIPYVLMRTEQRKDLL